MRKVIANVLTDDRLILIMNDGEFKSVDFTLYPISVSRCLNHKISMKTFDYYKPYRDWGFYSTAYMEIDQIVKNIYIKNRTIRQNEKTTD